MDLLKLTPNKINTSVTSKIFLFYGPPKTWKTTVASQFPGAIIAAAEKGYQMIDGVYAQPITKWTDFKEFVYALDDEQVKEKFKTVIIDTASNLYSMCENYIKLREKVGSIDKLPYGKGYKMCIDEFSESINRIPSAGYTLVFICHADENADDNGELVIKPKLDKRAYGYITGLADYIFYVRKEEDDDGSIKSFAYASLSAKTTCGGRGDQFISPRFVFTYPELTKQLKLAIEKQIHELGYDSVEDYGSPNNSMAVYSDADESLEDVKSDIYQALDVINNSNPTEVTLERIRNFVAETIGDRKVSEIDMGEITQLETIKFFLKDLQRELQLV